MTQENAPGDTAQAPPLDALFRPVDRSRPAAPQIERAIRTAILDMHLAPGQAISETALARAFGASRTPVRDALLDLQSKGLVTRLANRGTYVARLSRKGIRESQFLREALELANIRRLCARRLTDQERSELDRILARQADAIERTDRPAFQDADDAFHLALASLTGVERAAELLRREKAPLDRLRYFGLFDTDRMSRILQEHRAILAAIDDRRAPLAEHVAMAHLRAILVTLDRAVAEHGRFFDPE